MVNESFDAALQRNLSAFPPYMPEGFNQIAPFAIFHPGSPFSVRIVPFANFQGPREFGIELSIGSIHLAQTYVDTELQAHSAKWGYKLLDPPKFATFEEAVDTARRLLAAMDNGEKLVYARKDVDPFGDK